MRRTWWATSISVRARTRWSWMSRYPSRLVGNLTNLEYMDKMCPGDFTIDGDVMFTGSRVRVMEGGLVITGHMDLGSTGTVEVQDGTLLTGLLTQGGTPKITAGGGTTVAYGRRHHDAEGGGCQRGGCGAGGDHVPGRRERAGRRSDFGPDAGWGAVR